MKKNLVIGLVVAAIVATGLFVWSVLRGAGAGAVPAAAALDAETTVGTIGFDPVSMWGSTSTLLAALPGLQVDNAELKLVTPDAIREKLGFDPGAVDGWASVGIDSTAGFTLAMDSGVFGGAGGSAAVLMLVRVTDRARLFSAVERITGVRPVVSDEAGGSGVLTFGELRMLIGERRGMTIFASPLAAGDLVTVRPAFNTFLAASGTPLPRDDGWRQAFSDAPGTLSSWMFLGARGGLAWEKSLGLPGMIDVGVEHYAKLFPSVGLWNWLNDEPGGLIVTSPEAMRALEQIYRPRKAAPRLSAFLPAKSGAALRFSVNFPEVTSGIAALLPPNVPPQVRMGLEMGKAFLPMQAGVSWAEVTDAFSGHFAIGVDFSRLSDADDWAEGLSKATVGVAAIQNTDTADAFLTKVVNAAKEKLGLEIAAVDIAGARGFHVGPAAEGVTIVRKGDVFVMGGHEAVDSSVRGTGGISDPNARCLDDDVAFAMYWDAGAALDRLEAAKLPQGEEIVKFLRSQLNGVRGQSFEGRLVSNGMRLKGTARPLYGAMVSGLALLSAARSAEESARLRPVTARDSDEPRRNLELMSRGARAWFNEQKVDQTGAVQAHQFPGGGITVTAPDGWRESVCVEGETRSYTPRPEDFSHPVFKALGFGPSEPLSYQYQFVSEGAEGTARFTARAIGDLDCDGVYSTFERIGRVGTDGEVALDPQVYERDPLE